MTEPVPDQSALVGADFEVRPDFEPRTKSEALLLAQAWGRTLSHWNECLTHAPDAATATAACAQADAAEVQRLAALATMLPGTLALDEQRQSHG